MTRIGSRRRAAVLGGAVVLGALAVPAGAASAPFSVDVGGFVPPATDLQSFYPGNAVVRQGDSLTFRIQGFHTVTFLPRRGQLPPILAPTGEEYASVADPAGVPFPWAGAPELGFNPPAVAPSRSRAVTGRALVNSGLPQGRNPRFTVTFPRDGVYEVRCTLHPKMRGKVTVLPRRATPPRAAVQLARARAEQAADRRTAARLLAARTRAAGPRQVLTGVGTARFSVFRFAPANRTVPAGTTLNFRWGGRNEIHTVTFGPRPFLEQAGRTLFGQTLGPLGGLPSEPPGPGPVELRPDLHGNGFLNSGVLFDPGIGSGPHGFRVRFTTPGEYQYVCLVHADTMTGTIRVT